MPMSNPGHIPAVVHYLTGLAPTSLLDVGVGLGAYGFLARQYLDVAATGFEPANWRTRIDGVEIFDSYRNPTWDYLYNSVTIGDIRDRVAHLPFYDVILCNDVLEHVSQNEARRLIVALLGRCRALIATTPAIEFPQGPWRGNEAEAHRCTLTRADFPAQTREHRTGVTSLYVSWSDPASRSEIARLARSVPRIAYPRAGMAARLQSVLGRLSRAVSSAGHIISTGRTEK